MATASAMTDVSDVPEDSNSPPTLDANVEPDSQNQPSEVQTSTEAAIPQHAYNLRKQRKPSPPVMANLRKAWKRQCSHHAQAWTTLVQLCSTPTDQLSYEDLSKMQELIQSSFEQWRDSASRLQDLQSHLEGPNILQHIQQLQQSYDENETYVRESLASLQATIFITLQQDVLSREKATSSIAHVSSSHHSKKASSIHTRPARLQAGSSVSHQKSAAGSRHSSRASYRHSGASQASKAASYTERTAQTEIEAAVADAELRAAEEVAWQKESVAAQQAELAKAQANQQAELANQQAELAKAQAKLELAEQHIDLAKNMAKAAAW
uniref:Uncharacterized protein n=1 Tax=Micrurus spixii TaxID=129469 RepID=A0A2D4L8Y8_9SAUR